MKKYTSALLSTAVLFSSLTASAITLNISQLSCSGLGMAAGYTTINLVDANTVNMSSVKYFVTTGDENVKITNSEVLQDGTVLLSLYSKKFGSSFQLHMSAPVGPAQLIMSAGVDVLNCQSKIDASL